MDLLEGAAESAELDPGIESLADGDEEVWFVFAFMYREKVHCSHRLQGISPPWATRKHGRQR